MRLSRVTAGAGLAAVVATSALAGSGQRDRAPEVVSVRVVNAAGVSREATGFAAEPGRVLTVAHALDAAGRVSVVGDDGLRRRARVLRRDRTLDLALLSVPGLPGEPLRPAGSADAARVVVRRGERTKQIDARVLRAVTTRLRDSAAGTTYERAGFELEADILVGDSGAPVVGEDGRLVGAVFARSLERPRRAYVVGARAMRDMLR